MARPGDAFGIGRYEIALNDVYRTEGPNYSSTVADVSVAANGREVARLRPERRVYPVAGTRTTEAGIDSGTFRDVYVTIGDPTPDGGWTMRTYVKPLAGWIWGGAIVMALGGLLSLTDRRFRVAAGARRRSAATATE